MAPTIFAAETAKIPFYIQTGDAAVTLKRFAAQSGRELIYSGTAVQGVRTTSVQGEFTPREALVRMLAGTGLVMTVDEKSGSMAVTQSRPPVSENKTLVAHKQKPSMKKPNTLHNLLSWLAALALSSTSLPAQTSSSDTTVPTSAQVADAGSSQDETVTLSPFEVKGTSEEDGYATRETNSSARVAQSYIDTSQTISVINSQYMDDYNLQDTRRIMENMPNVYSGSTDQNSRVWIRGSEVDQVYVDGVIEGKTAGANAERPVPFYDRVELVSGPSSAAFGVGQPGGIINYVTKAPTGRTQTNFEAGFGQYQNYLANLDTQGVLAPTRFGKISYRIVGYWEQGNYQIQNEIHKGAGAMVALRDEIAPTLTASVNLMYSRSDFPISDQPFILYTNQTAYSWLMEIVGGGTPGNGIPTLPGTNPLPPPGDIRLTQGNWAGGQLLPAGTNGFPDNYGGFIDENFRGEFVLEKSFMDHALTIRNMAVLSTRNIDAQYVTWQGAQFIDPATGQPTKTVYPRNEGPIQDIALSLFGVEIWHWANFKADNLDIDFHKTFGGVKLRLTAGANIYNDSSTTPYVNLYSNFTKADGVTPQWNVIGTHFGINIYQHAATNIQSQTDSAYEWGGYLSGTASFLNDKVEIELSNRADASGAKTVDMLHSRIISSPLTHNKGAPRESVRFKPLPWLSLYALRAEHNDPVSLAQRFSLFKPGDVPGALAAINAKYNNFNNPFTIAPTGVLKEYGVKAEFLNGDIVFSADYFNFNTAGGLTTTVIADNNPSSPTYQSQVVENFIAGNQASGGEVSCAGRITNHLNFTFSYGVTRGKFANFSDGNPNFIAPPTTTNLHLKYDFGWMHGFDAYILGGVMRWGTFWDSQDPYIYYQDAQYVWDGGVGVRWDHGRQSLEFTEDNIGGKLPFISPQTAYAASSEMQQWFVKYKIKF